MSKTNKRLLAVLLAMLLTVILCGNALTVAADDVIAADSVDVSRDALTLRVGSSFTLKGQPLPVKADMSEAVWASDDEAVATVENGKVTAVAAGTTTVTVTVNGKSDTCEVTVVEGTASEADLVVDALLWTGGNGQVTPGTALTFQVKVTNQGTADVNGAFYVDISAGQNRIFRLEHKDGVKAGETVSVTSDPWTAVAGDHMMAVRVNPTLSVAEANESTNNTYQIGLRVADDRLAPADETVAALIEEYGLTNLTFSDDFDTLDTVDVLAGGKEGYKWYVTRRWSQKDMTRADYFVKDGVMTLQHEDCTYAIGASTMDPTTHTGYTFNHGYMEFRIRMPRPEGKDEGEKGKPAVWSLPTGKWLEIPGDNKHWVEVDWIEYYGDDYYTISVHEQEKFEDAEKNWYKNSGAKQAGYGDGEWHTLGFLWVEDQIIGYYDGEEIFNQTYGADEVPIPINQNMSGELKFDGVFDILDTHDMVLYIAGGIDMPMEIDYMRIWQVAAEEPVIEAVTDPTVQGGVTDQPPEEPEELPWLWIILGAVAVVAVVVAVIVICKGKQAKVESEPEAPEAEE